jgi:hypothetical protein
MQNDIETPTANSKEQPTVKPLVGDEIWITVNDVCRILRRGRTRINELLLSGELTRVKESRSTLITVESLKRFVAETEANSLKR